MESRKNKEKWLKQLEYKKMSRNAKTTGFILKEKNISKQKVEKE